MFLDGNTSQSGVIVDVHTPRSAEAAAIAARTRAKDHRVSGSCCDVNERVATMKPSTPRAEPMLVAIGAFSSSTRFGTVGLHVTAAPPAIKKVKTLRIGLR